ncbi:uncharacterized protein Z518_06582 [Rhinocladiella mackenziei CBS 650.93]|uniref:Peptidase S33 tripeptidyl aminopeptidase-like C-terminal domain-containing protein n=1 Tax=Rhinocladiella mackenziei CBS 650.93 TaxID=1442369 RepID=A0A0D2FM59_9EURO|nr:uncharacterized protein Z518_06582 [Rhinocladiella mackenziei CBS 650.93]KIX03032.1 hypothetical protein Z518_06582 [Rhinocladiella mackenziei CBS 650.93]
MAHLTALTTLSLLSATQAFPYNPGSASQHRTIEWHPCPDVEAELHAALPGVEFPHPFDCASLLVPLDYTDPGSAPLNLSLIRVNATKTPVLGSVLWNPGGPGGTGYENLAVQSDDLITTLGGQYNIISWDPRGTGRTIPFDCELSETGLQRRDAAALVSNNLTEYFLDSGWNDAQLYADACYQAQNETGRFLGTAFVARDMVEIIDALGEDGLLRYWGLSYGTLLGSTFASMFPERVARVLLDGNINPHDYQVGHWGNYLVDADKTLLAFLEECAKNKDRCALAQYTGQSTALDLLNIVNAALEPLGQNATTGPEAWSIYATLKQTIYSGLYFPRRWPVLAETITALLNGSSTDAVSSTNASATPVPYNLGVDSINGIRCSDTLWEAASAEDILDQVKYQGTVSQSFSDAGYFFTWVCAAWKLRAKEQYTGDFSAKTKFPILFVNGPFDVATPLVSAHNASAGFEGSVVLQHAGYGHGLTAHRSRCTDETVQAYFREGVLPEVGTICKPDVEAWDLQNQS